ncbi:MAG: cysteine--tRNA ligase [Candidatus Pacebacteria bacterium]|nr:cysteine--tRNA ligase [Candidatus Paceibacterota bacterium]
MTLRIYNTLTKQIEDFRPIDDKCVTMYSCGPTVYDFVHIGNLRTFMMADFLRRTLLFLGYEVKHIKNITDVGHLTQDDIDAGEDKMLKAAKREHKTPQDIARFYEEAFKKDEEKLHILPAYKFTRATEYIDEMIKLIEKLIAKGYAYETNGSVYYDINKFDKYGQLSGNALENLKIGARLEANPDKKNPYDLALWLKSGEEHLMKWQSPWSVGYPGWHIECSAMSIANLGETLDFHTGGEDNIFPHHENEIAQSEGATGKKFVNYWVHARFLLVDGEKMSKSKGNFYTLKDIEEKGFDPLVYRYLCLTAHFQSQMNFTWQSLKDSQNALKKLYAFAGSVDSKEEGSGIEKYIEKFQAALEDNLNTPLAIATVWEMIKDRSMSDRDRKTTLLKFDEVLGLGLSDIEPSLLKTETGEFELNGGNIKFSITRSSTEDTISEDLLDLVKERETARQAKDFATSDRLRNELKKRGYEIKDTAEGIEITEIE